MSKDMPKKIPFEELLKNLDGVVNTLEDGSLSLEDSLKAYEEGIALVRKAQGTLENMEERLMKLREKGSLEKIDVDT